MKKIDLTALPTVTNDTELIEYPLGSLFLDEDGVAYRLSGLSTDWNDPDLRQTRPHLKVHLTSGASTSVRDTPYPLTAVFIGNGRDW